MNSCCTLPVDIIAADKHRQNEECCLITEKTASPLKAACPVSRTLSRKVQHRTVEHLIKPEVASNIRNVQYYYCADSACDVVYFSDENAPFFTKDDIGVKVFTKDQGDDVNVCYCFNWSRGRIKAQIPVTGKSTAAFEIAKEVKAGRCECDIRNPKGECCLGDVNSFVKSITPTVAPT